MAEAEKAAEVKGRSIMMPVIIGINTLLVVGLAVVILFVWEGSPLSGSDSSPKEEQAADDPAGPPGPMLDLDTFIVHLNHPNASRYVRLSISVEVRAQEDLDALQLRVPAARNAIIAYLSDRNVPELQGSEKMAQLKSEITRTLQRVVSGARIRDVHITELLIQ